MARAFETFEVYQLATVLTAKIFKLLNQEKFKKEFEFSNQLKRATLSITNNIAEGCEYNTNAQFIRFLNYAKGSCGEVRNMLNLCNLLYNEDTALLIEDCKVVSKQLAKFCEYLAKSDHNK